MSAPDATRALKAAPPDDPYRRSLSIAFAVSLLLHLGAIAAIAFVPRRPDLSDLRENSVLVTFVEDPNDPEPPPAPAPRAPEPPKPVAKEPEPAPKPEPPKPEAKVVPEKTEAKKPPKPPARKPDPPKRDPKPEPRSGDPDAFIENLKRQRETASRPVETTRAGTGKGGTLSGFCEVRLGVYFEDVRSRVRGAWAYPGLDRRLQTDIRIQIDRGGQLLGQRVVTRSGDLLFDESVTRALTKATPFPPLPSCYTDPQLDTILEFRSWEVE